MSLRYLFCVMLIGTVGVSAANAQGDQMVRMTYPMAHKEITRLLDQLRRPAETQVGAEKAATRAAQGDSEEQTIPDPRSRAKEKDIQFRLKQPISFNFKDVPLKQVIEDLAKLSGLKIVPDTRAFQEARIDMNAQLTCNIEEVDMKFALQILLSPLRLDYIIENDMLKITTLDRINRLTRVTYPVADLVEPPPIVVGEKLAKSHEKVLMAMIVNSIAKNSWEEMGGTASVQYFPAGKALVISQSQAIHEEIQLLLATLRKLHDLSVTLDLRFVQASNEIAREWREGQRNASNVSEVDDPSKLLERIKSNRGSSILQLPLLRVLNGQNSPIECLQKQTNSTVLRTSSREFGNESPKDTAIVLSQTEKIVSGWRGSIEPIVSPDRQSVRLNVNLEYFAKDEAKSVERSLKASKTFNIPDGRTLVWDLGAIAENQHLFVLVTPRVVVRQEEAGIFLGELRPIPGR